MKQPGAIERILIAREKVLEIEGEVRFHEHLRRYAAVRRFCYGNVLDFASGCGYGSFLLSVNPEVTRVVGVDKDEDAIKWARSEFKTDKTEFRDRSIEEISEPFDTLVCLEVIEHLKDTTVIPRLAQRCAIDNVVISFPNKKSTHFNRYHLHDFCAQDILNLMSDHVCYHDFTMGDVQMLLFTRKPSKAPSHIYRNLLDLR